MLLDELRRAWPPADPAGPSDYVHGALASTRPVAAWELPAGAAARTAVVVAEGPGDRLALVTISDGQTGWRRAREGDGASVALVDAIGASTTPASGFRLLPIGPHRERPPTGATDLRERAVGVDQTNESVVVGDALVVKWIVEPRIGRHPAPALLAHLAELGFSDVPAPYGILGWERTPGEMAVCALVDAYLPDARDGWSWCVDVLLEHLEHLPNGCRAPCAGDIGPTLGGLTARLHAALASPSTVIPAPVDRAGPAAIAEWRTAARATLAAAVELAEGPDRDRLTAWRPSLERVLDSVAAIEDTVVQPIHGDLHVGQVLRWRGGHAVIDFDGNPMLTEEDDQTGGQAPIRPQAAARDVAQLSMSIDHVGRVANRRAAQAPTAEVERWIARNRAQFLEAYRDTLHVAGRSELLDDRLLRAFEVEQECRELVYAARFLPRWRYAPMAALEALMR